MSRASKRMVSGFFSTALSTQLRKLALEEGKTLQAVLGEAIDMMLVSRGIAAAGER